MKNQTKRKLTKVKHSHHTLNPYEINSHSSIRFKSNENQLNNLLTQQPLPIIQPSNIPQFLPKYCSSRITRDFFLTDAITLSQRLLGKIIVRVLNNKIIRCRIVETEAYMGLFDKGSHVSKVGKTERTKAFWCKGGHLYIYMIYGINYCMNIIANDEYTPQGCLIRAAEPIEGIEIIKENRGIEDEKNLTNGPGKLTASLKIDKSYNCIDLCDSQDIFIINDDEGDYKFEIMSSPRVNIEYAKDYKNKLWRFYIKDNKYVSKLKK